MKDAMQGKERSLPLRNPSIYGACKLASTCFPGMLTRPTYAINCWTCTQRVITGLLCK